VIKGAPVISETTEMSGILRITLTHCPKCTQKLPEPVETWRRERFKVGADRAVFVARAGGPVPPGTKRKKLMAPMGKYDVSTEEVSISFS
jgi:hypothetical protein